MTDTTAIQLETKNKMMKTLQYKRLKLPILGSVFIFGTLTVALYIIILVKINKKFSENGFSTEKLMINSKLLHQSSDLSLAESIRIDEVMTYLNELQHIATAFNGTRAVNTPGFNSTLDYIVNYLTANTNYKVNKNFFYMRDFSLANNPVLISSINGVKKNYTYSTNLSTAEFYHVKFSISANFSKGVPLTLVPNGGCTDDDWRKAKPPPQGRVVLVERGICFFYDKAVIAAKYKVAAILFFNDGLAPDRFSPEEVVLAEENALPALFLSHAAGEALANAALDLSSNANVQLFIDVKDLPDFPVGNICADTPTGDPTQTIVIGSHSDSVTEGAGINDNGSGSAANLALAVTLARLFRSPAYPKYKYRVRFCWWGAEEEGLVGSVYHVIQALSSTVVGERFSDYLVNLNYDMLGSPNYIFGIYDGRTVRNDTPTEALSGSNKITALFRDWFVRHKLPWDYTGFDDRSDYFPFLAGGIVAGGLFSGADDVKTQQERDRYDEMLGQGAGGIAGIIHDPCYHKECDTIQNINVFGYEKMVQAAAYALEFLGRHNDLKSWLYASSDSH
ncbi:unnamed protein product [Rotaria socialis]|uniref:Peptide hydrolase n=1 Tax=Rotaria socialis TaxID=392032 RepID=A0A818L406_9BILA|nr:unnamed protein product [Rotaria socialis]CAF4508533.1 unnamed protein product [Rotaria socialis]